MHDSDLNLPAHPTTGLVALGRRRNGDPIWPIAGAAPDDDLDDDDDTAGDDPDGDDGADDGQSGDGDDGADQLGDAGKKALDRMKQELRREKRRRKAAEEKAQKAQGAGKGSKDGDGDDLEEVRRQAAEQARAEALKERTIDKIEARARKFADPEDAAAILLRGREVDDFIDDGQIDTSAIDDALAELAEAKPHLVARNASSGGGFDSGRGKRSDKAQLTRADLKTMTPAEVQRARREGRLDRLMGKTK